MYRLPHDGSGKEAVQIPPAALAALAVDPEQRLGRIACDEILAGDIDAIPPARLDALATGEQSERPVVLRDVFDLCEAARRIEDPERARERQPRALVRVARLGRAPGVTNESRIAPGTDTLIYAVRTTTPPERLVPAVREAVTSVDPNLALAQIITLQAMVDRASAQMTFTIVWPDSG